MMNIIGKGMILIYTIGCVAGLLLAFVIYADFVDWGRSEPRLVRGGDAKSTGNDMRIASEYEKSKAVLEIAKGGADLVLAPLAPAEAALQEAQQRFAQNHLFYVAELNNLEKGPGDIQVKRLPPEGIPTDTPGKPLGKPIPSVPVAGLNKSLATYAAILKTEQDKIKPIEDAVQELAKKNSDISYQLTGKNEAGKKDAHGLFELVDVEFKQQQMLREEYEYVVQPQWASTTEEARRYNGRRTSLEETLSGLEKVLKEREAKRK